MALSDLEGVLNLNARIGKIYPNPNLFTTATINDTEVVGVEIIKPKTKHCLPLLLCAPEDVFDTIERCKICDKHI